MILMSILQDVHGDMETIFLTRETDSRIENVSYTAHFIISIFTHQDLEMEASIWPSNDFTDVNL